jgi:hypothetical protein
MALAVSTDDKTLFRINFDYECPTRMKKNVEELTDSLMGAQNNLVMLFYCQGRLIPSYRSMGRSGEKEEGRPQRKVALPFRRRIGGPRYIVVIGRWHALSINVWPFFYCGDD